MKVSRQSTSLLTLRSRSWDSWLISPLLIGVGLAVSTLLVGKSVLECDRAVSDQCTITHSNAFNQETRTFPIASLQEAKVETSRRSSGSRSNRTSQVVLLTSDGRVPLSRVYTSGWGKHTRQADQANQFIATPTIARLYLSQDTRWIGAIVMLFFGGGGLVLLLNTKVTTCTFDKSTNQCTLRLVGLTGVNRYQCSLPQILGMRVDLSGQTKAGDDDKPNSRLTIVLKTGETIPLAKIYGGDLAKHESVARQVHEFLRLPLLPPWDASKAALAYTKVALPLMTGGQSQQLAAIAECQQTLHQNPDDVKTYQRLAIALSAQGQKEQAQYLLETGRSRFQSYGEFEKAAHLDYLLTLLKLKAKTHWWESC